MPRTFTLIFLLASAAAVCAGEDAPPESAGEIGFANKVWQVRDSSAVAPGTLYVFLSEGTLLITSPHSEPLLGTWKEDDGALTMVEEGVSYKVEILHLGPEEFRIRSHNPGQAVEITLVPAGANTASPAPGAIWGTAWLLEDLGGAGVLDRVEATLEFIESGKVAGRASCNRFFGSVEIDGDVLTFSPLGSTRMACAEAVAMQETKYLKALEAAERFVIDGSVLMIYSRELDAPLRFTRTAP